MPDSAIIVLFALAVARVTLIITDDDILKRPRAWIVNKVAPNDGDEHPIATLVTCPWCMSVWVGCALAPLVYYHYGNPLVYMGGLVLAASQVTGMIANVGR